MKKILCILCGAILFPLLSFCQIITGKVIDPDGRPAAGVNVLVLRAKDSVQLNGTASDHRGAFTLKGIPTGAYLLTVSSVGYAVFYMPFLLKEKGQDFHIPSISLRRQTASLQEVQVTGKKSFIEQRIDRMIVNVAGSIISTGSTALEILQKTPGISIDQQNDLLRLRGKEGVIVQIDGKQTYLPAEQVVAMLRNMPGGNIDRIEIITNPSAKYDAAGNAGIIDIRLKKNNSTGTNGSVSLSGGSGKYDRERGSFQLNHKTNRFNFFTSYAFNHAGDYWDFRFHRILQDGAGKNFVHQTSPVIMHNSGHNAKAGIDFQLSPFTTLGLLWTGSWTKREENSSASTDFRHEMEGPVYLETSTRKTTSTASSNQLGSFNFLHTFKKGRGQLSGNLDVGRFNRNFFNALSIATVIPSDPAQPLMGLLSIMPTAINIFTFGADYNRSCRNGWNLQAGWKSSVVRSSNDMKLSQGESGHLKIDSVLSNNFVYKESIHAAYLNASGKLDSVTEVQAGLRIEQTLSDAYSVTQAKEVKRNYLNFFPSVFINRKLSGQHSLAFSYSYRINRPSYQNLNPVRSYLDPYAYFKGNAFLRPDYTHSFEFKHGYKDKIFTLLGASFTNDVIFFILQPVDSKTSERTPANIGKSASYDLTVTAPVKVTKGWALQWTAVGTFAKYNFTYIDSFFRSKQLSGKLNATNSFVFGNGWTAELSGWISTPAIESVWRYPWLASADAGIQKAYHSLKVKFSLSDLFHSDIVSAKIKTPQFSNDVRIKFDTRVALLDVIYNFGNQQMKNRQRKTGSEEELKRMN
ncbi:MAG: TonB-dependent receptor [Chitinophagaceae bacterium]|nr:TonB-dependent receptor [Chitinophagaceae bacterium]